MAIFGLVGSGGFAREVMPLMKQAVANGVSQDNVFFIVPDSDDTVVNGIRQISEAEFLALKDERFFNIAIGDSRKREAIARLYERQGCIPLSLAANGFQQYDNCDVGVGAIFCGNSMLTSNLKIGRYFHANIYSYVAHDCIIGDFVTFAPGVHCNGNVVIGDHAYIGTGAILRHGTPDKPLCIGAGAVVGMGAVVTRDVEPGVTVVGNPAKIMAR